MFKNVQNLQEKRKLPHYLRVFIYNSVSMMLPTKITGVWTQKFTKELLTP